MSLLSYWPTSTEIDQCIKWEAEGAHDSVLLAVHQPSPLTYKEGLHGKRQVTTEDELYQYFVTPHVPTGAHVVPITGASGVGKSHLVRLLAARLQSEETDGRYVVIRIPKSASLRRVVELILEPLPSDRYASVKKEFEQALEEVNLETAPITFQAHLEIALGAYEKELREQFRMNSTNQSLKAQIAHARDLPKFFADPEVSGHFRKDVFPRIVKRAVTGQGSGVIDDRVEDFSAGDFDLPSEIDLSYMAVSTRNYYSMLVAKDGAGMREAAALLNGRVVDHAIGQLFKLHKQMGGMTLQDVILEIRSLLLKDDRELVILVEDFKALTGIQETLLNVLIQEGVRDGEKIYATMRSVIAVTDGYLEGQDTIATRANREWQVESHLNSDADVLARTKTLVASYLNAARWGQEELKRHYASRKKGWNDNAWVGAFKDVDEFESNQLAAFGKIGDIPLFPFTEQAIEQLARMTLKQGDALVYTPRFIIQRILRNILLHGREAFAENQFPPPSIDVQPAATDVAQWLASLRVSEVQRCRYERIVAIWGNAPTTREEIGRIHPDIFKVFDLEAPGIEAPPAPMPRREELTEKGKEKEPIKSTPVTDLQDALEKWVQKDVRLDQTVASQVRRALADMINERIDWNGERCVKSPIAANQISIPHASGEGSISEISIKIAPNNKDPDGRLRSELIALIRFHHYNKKQAEYEEVDDDLARIGNLVSRLLPNALKIVRSGVEKQLLSATKILATNSRLLGLIEKGRTPQALSSFLFSPVQLRDKPPEGANMCFHEWRAVQDNALRIRSRVFDLVFSTCSSFQGTARSAYGVDIVRIAENFGSDLDKADLGSFGSIDTDFKQLLQEMSEMRILVRAKKVYEEAARIKKALDAEFGDNFNKSEVADSLKQLTEDMQAGMWDPNEIGQTVAKFKQLCDDFRDGALKEALTTLQASALAEDGKNDGKAISHIALLDVTPLIIAHTFVNAAVKVINAAQRHAKLLESQVEGVDPMAQANELRTLFTNLVSDIDALEAKGEK